MTTRRDEALKVLQRRLVRAHQLAAELAAMPLTRTAERVRAIEALEAATASLVDALAEVDAHGGLYPPTGAVPSAQLPPVPAPLRLGPCGIGGGRRVHHKACGGDNDSRFDNLIRLLEG